MKLKMNHSAAALFAWAALGASSLFAQDALDAAPSSGTPTTVTNVTGTISQLNYDSNGSVEGFLVGTNVLLSFPTSVPGGASALGAAGNSVTYSGTEFTTSAGFSTVRVSSFTNNTTKATYSSSTTTPASTAYGPTTGTIKQLNFDDNGSPNGFVFAPSAAAASVLVNTGVVTSTALTAALTVGASVSVTGLTFTLGSTMCTLAGSLTVVDATTLVVGGTTYVLTGGGPGAGGPIGPGRGGRH